jgi:hypothetical protein
MTRVNVVPPKELCNQHLMAEYREMPRLLKNLKSSLNRKSSPFSMSEISNEYILGSGHVKFFFDKFQFLYIRHKIITKELLLRNYNLSMPNLSDVFLEVDKKWFNNYEPDANALRLNRERIKIRMPKNPIYSVK